MFKNQSSNFFYQRDPAKFLDKQSDYIARTELAVESGAEYIQDAVAQERDLCIVFKELLATLATTRHDIAVDHETEHAENFGLPCDQEALFPGVSALTPLFAWYESYNLKLLPKLQTYLANMKHTLKKFDETDLKISSETCMGRETYMDISILTYEDREKWTFDTTHKNYEQLCHLCSVTPLSSTIDINERLKQLRENKVAMQTLKRVSIQDYKKIKLALAIVNAKQNSPAERMSDWVLATQRMEVNGKMYALSQYLTWMYRTHDQDPVERMSGHSIISILHQDPFLIKDMLEDVAKIFKEAIQWDGQDIQTLKNNVALLQYEFSHAMPFMRGSAAIGEWLEMIIYRFHSLGLSYNSDVSVNMEALTLPLKEFVDKYPSLITLEPFVKKLTINESRNHDI